MGEPMKQGTEGPSKVLHLRGLPQYTTEMELQQLLAPFGQVMQFLLLRDKGQAFVQMQSPEVAAQILASVEHAQAHVQIRGKQVYFQYSSRQEIEHKNNSAAPTCTLLITVQNVTVPVALDHVFEICKPYGDVLKIITFAKGPDFQALVQMGTVEQAVMAKNYLEGQHLFEGCCRLRVAFSNRSNLVVKENSLKSRDFTQQLPNAQFGMLQNMGVQPGFPAHMPHMPQMPQMQGQQHPAAGSTVVLVNKLSEEVKCFDLFQLFGVYGDVQRVKILYNKRNTAMVQFATHQQAATACQNLNNCPLRGSYIYPVLSKHREVQLPREVDDLSLALTKDYSGHASHRYRNKSMVNHKNINAPSQVLHVSNLHDSASEQELGDLFAEQQATDAASKPVVEFFKSNRKMAYVAMSSLEEAVAALIALHHTNLGGYPLRVSFSHKQPENITNSDVPQTSEASQDAGAGSVDSQEQ